MYCYLIKLAYLIYKKGRKREKIIFNKKVKKHVNSYIEKHVNRLVFYFSEILKVSKFLTHFSFKSIR